AYTATGIRAGGGSGAGSFVSETIVKLPYAGAEAERRARRSGESEMLRVGSDPEHPSLRLMFRSVVPVKGTVAQSAPLYSSRNARLFAAGCGLAPAGGGRGAAGPAVRSETYS